MTGRPIRITAVHQGYELYGSDRSFIQCVEILRSYAPNVDLTVLLPREGPLSDRLREAGFAVRVEDLWVLRKSIGMGLLGRLLQFPAALARALKTFRQSDLVYVNTAVVADYLVAARLNPNKAVAHIRELPTGVTREVLARLVKASRASVIFNSSATAGAFATAPGVSRFVVHNGFQGPATVSLASYDATRPLRVLMLGRINAWKGQDLLVEAISTMCEADRERVSVRVVGDAFEGQPFRKQLEERVRTLGLERSVLIEPFVEDPSDLFQWCDLVVVPSRRPEPFGRVAIEGMAWGRPVIAAAHGGLTEIVHHSVSGALFQPNDPRALADALRAFLTSPELVRVQGAAARRSFETTFTEASLTERFTAAVAAVRRRCGEAA